MPRLAFNESKLLKHSHQCRSVARNVHAFTALFFLPFVKQRVRAFRYSCDSHEMLYPSIIAYNTYASTNTASIVTRSSSVSVVVSISLLHLSNSSLLHRCLESSPILLFCSFPPSPADSAFGDSCE